MPGKGMKLVSDHVGEGRRCLMLNSRLPFVQSWKSVCVCVCVFLGTPKKWWTSSWGGGVLRPKTPVQRAWNAWARPKNQL